MDNQKIIDNMPEGATHVLGGNCYCNEYVREDHESDGYGYLTYVNNETTTEGHRSLADIKRIAELEKELEFFYQTASDSLAPPKEQGE
jgi:hypothetical protein